MAPRGVLPEAGGNRRAIPEKGSLVYVEGRIKTRKWRDRDGNDRYSTEVEASEMRMPGGKPDGEQSRAAPAPSAPQPAPARSRDDDFDDDIHF
jgi:single-strand DNA-binding protein